MSEKIALIRLSRVLELTGLSRSSVYSRIQAASAYFDPSFPKPVKLSPNGRSVAWYLAEIEAWIESRRAFRA